jgi:hypothetical protein
VSFMLKKLLPISLFLFTNLLLAQAVPVTTQTAPAATTALPGTIVTPAPAIVAIPPGTTPASAAVVPPTSTSGLVNPPIIAPLGPTTVAATPAFLAENTMFVQPPTPTEIKPLCPPLSQYSVPAGYRIAGISPGCLAVPIPLSENTP